MTITDPYHVEAARTLRKAFQTPTSAEAAGVRRVMPGAKETA
jgi:hypothetical protein